MAYKVPSNHAVEDVIKTVSLEIGKYYHVENPKLDFRHGNTLKWIHPQTLEVVQIVNGKKGMTVTGPHSFIEAIIKRAFENI